RLTATAACRTAGAGNARTTVTRARGRAAADAASDIAAARAVHAHTAVAGAFSRAAPDAASDITAAAIHAHAAVDGPTRPRAAAAASGTAAGRATRRRPSAAWRPAGSGKEEGVAAGD